MEIPRTLVLTGHFPPEPGGVQTFTWELVRRLPVDRVVVVAPAWPGSAEFDAALAFPVVRRHGYLLFRGLRRLVVRHRVEAGWITAAAPFGMYAPLVRAAGVRWLVGSAHGQELGWFRAPPTRVALRAAARSFDVLTHLSATTLPELQAAVGDRTRLARLAGAVDTVRFRPGLDGSAVRRRHGLGNGPVVLSVARLVRRKGHDMLIRAWADVVRRRPDARLVIVGDGPMRRRLVELADREVPGTVTVTGPVSAAELPRYYAAADVFALPCRDDRAGLQTEGLGLSVLEASASGLPVVVGRSGGSPESLINGRTGVLVDAAGPDEIALALHRLLGSPERAAAMGAAGRRWTCERWSWDAAAARLAGLLKDSAPEAPPKHDTPGMEPAWDSGSS
ncbi:MULTISPECIES: glycosyltransferase family 4 protein [unclassified Actinomadura]|uniref:glycosyltransferase family 4 protein n=1 Tax=unclassified Actinomadura TaxID=2626254 RepID=UPI00190F4C1E|nr:glycosyltransferase family 4 protein [Actinomadura sp. K4S16]